MLLIVKLLSNWGLSRWFYCSNILCDACPCMTLLLINSSLHDKCRLKSFGCVLRLIIYCVKEKGELRNIFVSFQFHKQTILWKREKYNVQFLFISRRFFTYKNDMDKNFPSIHNIALSSKFMFKVLLWNLIIRIVKDQRFI